jgi:hypothetical protein
MMAGNPVMLLLVILGTLNRCTSYQALEAFAQRHYQALVNYLQYLASGCPRIAGYDGH